MNPLIQPPNSSPMKNQTASTQELRTATHTPGPWYRKIRGTSNAPLILVTDSDLKEIASTQGAFRDVATSDANARLIAAAPALLEALKAIAGYNSPASGPVFDRLESAQEFARAAIQSATL